jgi:hypothetical protein
LGHSSRGTFEPASIDAVKAGRTQIRREKGNYPATVNEDGWPRLFKRLAAENGFRADDVDLGCVKTQTRSLAAEETFVRIADSCANIS